MKQGRLKNGKGEYISPVTDTGSVYDPQGNSLDSVVEEVKNELDKKADKSDIPDISKIGKQIFVAKFGVTTFQEMKEAYNAGMILFATGHPLNPNKLYALLTYRESDSDPLDNRVSFTSVDSSYCYYLEYDGEEGWMLDVVPLENSKNKKTAISGSGNTTDYPSTKAIVDYIKSKTIDKTGGNETIKGSKSFTDIVVDHLNCKGDGETVLFDTMIDEEEDHLRINLQDSYDGESVLLGHVADPALDCDAVNKRTLNKAIKDSTITAKDAEGEGTPVLPIMSDAPTDGKQYARQNGGWTEVQGGESGEWKTVCENYQLAVGSKKFVFTQCADGTPIDADEAICMIKYGQSSAAHNGYFAIYNDAGEKCSFGAIVYENTAPNGRYNVLHAKKYGEMYLYQMFPNVDYIIANSAATNTGLGNYKFTTRFTQIAAEPNYVIDGETYINIYVKNK